MEAYSNLVFDADRLGQWVLSHTNEGGGWGDFQAIGSERDGEIIAAVVFNRYTGRDMMMHVAAKPGSLWAKPAFLAACFSYPFHQLGCERVTAIVSASNAPSLRLVRKLGFVQEGVIRRGAVDGDQILFGMLRSECRYEKPEAAQAA